ncbi:MAG: hypothetical protein Q7T66_01745 [Herminiimonas sp.]|jgi:hypothetical protein|uniref:hypothetical protein n=1 Tax=Herminiimonas sp. TaxID=1926289 RepID=UPI002726893D|nr:hypothetical protein [Herminiimonas sp.]MDO9419363.1 hypothetical protein [Herminiimonas sp.]
MNKTMTVSAGILAAAVLMFSAAPAMARVDVGVNIGVPGPVYYAPEPVYVQPRPVYVQPRPVYYAPQPYYGDRHHHRHHDRHYRRDNDRDGVPNRYDRRPNNPHRY